MMKPFYRVVTGHFFHLLLLFVALCVKQACALEANLVVKTGYFAPMNEDFREKFGGGISVEGEVLLWTESNTGWSISLDYIRSGRRRIDIVCVDFTGPCISNDYVTRMIIPLAVSRIARLDWKFDGEAYQPYLGAGIGLYLFVEKNDYGSTNVYNSKGVPGLNLLCGVNRDISNKMSFVLEIKYSKTIGRGIPGADGDGGGFLFSGGLRF